MIKLEAANESLEISKNGSRFGDFIMATFGGEKIKMDNCLYNIIVNAYDKLRKEGDEISIDRSSLQMWIYNRMNALVGATLEI